MNHIGEFKRNRVCVEAVTLAIVFGKGEAMMIEIHNASVAVSDASNRNP